MVGQLSSLERGRESAWCTLLYHPSGLYFVAGPLMSDPSQYVSWLGAFVKAHSIDRWEYLGGSRSIQTPAASLGKHIDALEIRV